MIVSDQVAAACQPESETDVMASLQIELIPVLRDNYVYLARDAGSGQPLREPGRVGRLLCDPEVEPGGAVGRDALATAGAEGRARLGERALGLGGRDGHGEAHQPRARVSGRRA